MKDQHGKLKLYTSLIALSVFALAALLYCAGVFSFFENKTYDSRMNVLSRFTQPSQDIVFIGIDQSSLDEGYSEKGWSWPWPRKAYANVVDFMNMGKAQSIAFDVLYTEPSIYGEADDDAFANACANYGKVILASSATENAGATFPIEKIRKSVGMVANVTSIKDKDGIIRRGRIGMEVGGIFYPSLAVAPTVIDSDNVAADIEALYATLPLDKDGAAHLRYKGSIDRYAHYRAIDIIKSYDAVKNGKTPLIEPENFEGATVYFLFYAPGLYDICATPISEMYPGAGCSITMLDNLLKGDFLKNPPLWAILLYLLVWAALGAILVYKAEVSFFDRRTMFLILSAVLALLVIVALGYALFAAGIIVPIVAPLFCFAIILWLGMLSAHSIEGKQKKFIQGAFSQYLSPSVIENLIENPQSLKLGGEKRNISIFFSDIQSFTSLSESLEPERLTEILNEYLTALTDTILETGGTIDKYEGDAIIAFWNAPTDEEDHAKRALEAAIRCQQKLEEMAPGFIKKVGRPLSTRIGLNTGDAIVGNMGSSKRFDYTMLGDAVNLASRLEGINKQFGTYLMCSEETKAQAEKFGAQLHFRELGRVAVVGKSQAVTVYEPMTREAASAKYVALQSFDMALDLFYSGKFDEAKSIFDKTATVDAAAQKYSQKCTELLASPPENWQGVWQATEK